MTFPHVLHRHGSLRTLLAGVALASLLMSILIEGPMAALLPVVPTAQAAEGIHKPMSYQGKISLTNGTAIGNGNYNMRFKIFDAASGGSELWSETWNTGTARVTMTGGLFSVALGTHTAMTGVDFNDDSLFLQVEFDPGNDDIYEETFSPRRRFNAVPYAHNADTVDGLHARQFLRNDVNATASGTLTIKPNDSSKIGLNILSTAGDDSVPGLKISTDGANHILLGTGGTTYDVNLYRFTANVLKTDDSFYALGTISGSVLKADTLLASSGSLAIEGAAYLGATLTVAGNATFDTNTLFVDASANRVGIGTTSPGQELEIIGTASGRVLHAQDQLRSSGSLLVEGSSYLQGSFFLTAITSCTGLQTDSGGQVSCGTGGSGFGTGNVLTIGDSRYVNVAGDTMTGALVISKTGTGLTLSGGILRGMAVGTPLKMAGIDTVTLDDAAVVDGYAYVTAGSNGGTCSGTTLTGCEFRIYDVTNPGAITSVAGLDIGRSATDVVVRGRYAYVATTTNVSGDDVLIVDISNPTSPLIVGGVEIGASANALNIEGSLLFIGSTTSASTCSANTLTGCEFRIYSISNPVAPSPVSGVDVTISVRGIQVQGRYAYIVNDSLSGNELRVIDIADPVKPVDLGGADLGATALSLQVTGKYAYVTNGAVAGTCSGTTLTGCEFRIYDISVPASVTAVSGIDNAIQTNGVTVAGKYAYVSMNTVTGDDLKIIDVSAPDTPRHVGGIDLSKSVQSVRMVGKLGFVVTSSGTGDEFFALDLPGADLPAATIGALATNFLSVSENAIFSGNVSVHNSLNVGPGGIQSQGPLAVFTGSGGVGMTGALIRSSGRSGALLALDSYRTQGLSPHILFGYRGNFDTNLYRYDANILMTDDSFHVNGSVVLGDSSSDIITPNGRFSGSLVPNATNTYDLGTDDLRWRDLYLSGGTLRMGTSGNEALIRYNTAANRLGFDPDGDATDEFVILDSGSVGIGTLNPETSLEVVGTMSGRTIHAQDSLRSSGSLLVEGTAILQGNVAFKGFASCTALETSSTGALLCGTDDGGGATGNFDQIYDQSVTDTNLAMEIDNGELIFDLTSTYDFVIRDGGVNAMVRFDDGGTTIFEANTEFNNTTYLDGNVTSNNPAVVFEKPINVGGVTGNAYNAFAEMSSPGSMDINADIDLFIEGSLEVDNTAYFDGNTEFNNTAIFDGNITSNNTAIVIEKPINVGGINGQSYNTISDLSSASHGDINTENDLFIEGSLEVDNAAFFDGTAEFNSTAYFDGNVSTNNTGIVFEKPVAIGGASAQGYNLIAEMGSAGHTGDIASDNDLYIEGSLEVDNVAYFDSNAVFGSGLQFTSGFSNCTALETDASGNLVCGSDDAGSSYSFSIYDGATTENIANNDTINFSDGTDINVAISPSDTVTISFTNASGYINSTTGDTNYVNVGGDTMNGTLIISAGTPIQLSSGGFNSCTALETDASGNLVCGTDDSGGALDFDQVYNTSYSNLNLTMEVDSGELAFNLDNLYDFVIQDSGGTMVRFDDGGTTIFETNAEFNNSAFFDGNVTSNNSQIIIEKALNVGGVTGQNYNALSGIATAGHTTEINDDNDLFIEDSLEVDGNVFFDGSNIRFSALTSCTALETDADGDLVCGTDDGGSGGLTNTGAILDAGNSRFVNVSGDTMTGALTIGTQKQLTMSGGTIWSAQRGTLTTPGGIDLGASANVVLSADGKYAFVGTSAIAGTCSGTTLTGCEFRIYDVSTPASPAAVAGIDFAIAVESMAIYGHHLFVGLSSVSGYDLRIIDISNPSAPVMVSGIELGADAQAIAVAGKRLFVGTSAIAGTCSRDTLTGCELREYDISDPWVPRAGTGVDLTVAVNGLALQGRYLYSANATVSGSDFRIYDTGADKNALRTVGGVDLGIGGRSVYVSGRYAYVTTDAIAGTCSGTTLTGCEFRLYDVNNPASPAAVGGLAYDVAVASVQVAGRYAYLALATVSGNDIRIADVATPGTPLDIGGGADVSIGVNSVFVLGKYLYAGLASVSGNDFRIYDLGGIDAPSAKIGALATNFLSVSENALISNTLTVGNSINVGRGGIQSLGPLSVFVGSGSTNGNMTGALIRSHSRTGALLALDSYALNGANGVTAPHILFGYRGTFDTNLYRSASNTLTTDDQLLLKAVDSENRALLVLDTEESTTTQNMFTITSDATTPYGGPDENLVFRIQADGTVHSDNSYNSMGADYAEWFFSLDKTLKPGDVVCVDTTRENAVRKCDRDADGNVMGIISTNPAFIGNVLTGADGLPVPGYVLVGLIGQVPAKVIVESGATIRPGDGLTPAAKPGFARKARAGESTVGVALEGLEAGEGVVNVLISRRNQSLTAQAVEDRVLETIQELEIGDEVRIMVSQAMEEFDAADGIALEVEEQLTALNLEDRIRSIVSQTLSGSLQGEPDGDAFSDLHVGGLLTASGSIRAAGDLAIRNVVAEDTLTVGGDARVGGDLYLEGALKVTELYVPGGIAVDGSASFGGTLTAGLLHAGSGSSIDGTLAVAGDLSVGGRLSLASGSILEADDLLVRDAVFVMGNITIKGLAIFEGDVDVRGQLILSNRQAGFALVATGATRVDVRFSSGFTAAPIVHVTPNSFVEAAWRVTPATATGFAIEIRTPAEEAFLFSWTALGVADPLTAISDLVAAQGKVPFPVDALGIPVSTNDAWNACIRNQTILDDEGLPLSCARYHNANVWEHPDLRIFFTYNDNVTPPLLDLPPEYEAVPSAAAWSLTPADEETDEEEDAGTGAVIQEETETGTGTVVEPDAGTGDTAEEIPTEPEPVVEEPAEIPEEPVTPEEPAEPVIEEPAPEEPAGEVIDEQPAPAEEAPAEEPAPEAPVEGSTEG